MVSALASKQTLQVVCKGEDMSNGEGKRIRIPFEAES